MFEAQYLWKGDAVFSPWMRRRGDNLVVTAEVAARTGSGAGITVKVYHKNMEDTGPGDPVGATITMLSVGRADAEYNGLEELVRYKFELPAAAAAGSNVLFRMLRPVWFDDLS